MNKERAINILLEHAIRSTDSSDDAYAPADSLTAAILFMERDRDQNKVDASVEVKGVTSKVTKGV